MRETYAQWRERIARVDALNEAFWAMIDHNYDDAELNALVKIAKDSE